MSSLTGQRGESLDEGTGVRMLDADETRVNQWMGEYLILSAVIRDVGMWIES